MSSRLVTLPVLALLGSAAACSAFNYPAPPPAAPPPVVPSSAAMAPGAAGTPASLPARAELRTVDGQTVGVATLTDTPNGVLIQADLSNLPPGSHGMHVHEAGACTPTFDAAGGHFNPGNRAHGALVPAGMHAGDLPNIRVPESGRVQVEVLEPGVTLDSGPNRLLDTDGAALVVHSSADDYSSQPAGNAGSRIACGVITR